MLSTQDLGFKKEKKKGLSLPCCFSLLAFLGICIPEHRIAKESDVDDEDVDDDGGDDDEAELQSMAISMQQRHAQRAICTGEKSETKKQGK